MKRPIMTLTVLLAAAAMVATFSCPASAAVTGVCSDCHTMHNSQGGSAVAIDDTGTLTTTPQGHLAKASCLGCHGKGGSTIGGAPNIFATTTNDMTAGGSFDTGIAAAMANRHDITDVFTGGDTSYALGTVVNGTPGAATGTLGLDMDATTLRCAGAKGCHGNHTGADSDAGIKGFHHGSTAYRYLQTKAGLAISGKGAAAWEKIAGSGPGSASTHNVYSSDATYGISVYCAECHGNFHGSGNTKSGTTWIRHPTDEVLTGLFSGVTSITVDYQNTPFAFDDISELSTTVAYTKTDAEVMCLSCHRAHGSAYNDILRFEYETSVSGEPGYAGGGGTTGCLNCHVHQR